MRMAFVIILESVPLIILLMGGIFMSPARRMELLYWAAEYIDRATRGLHDLIAEELDRLSVAGR